MVLNCQTNWPYTPCGRDFIFNQLLLVMRSRGEPLATTCKVVTAYSCKLLKLLQKSMFLSTFGNLNESNITYYPQLDNNESEFHSLFIGKIVLTYFLVYWKFLLYKSGTIVCPFIVILKHKCRARRSLQHEVSGRSKQCGRLVQSPFV